MPGAARVDGNVNALGVYVVDTDNKVVGGLGPPAFGSNWNDAPAAGGEGLEIIDGRAPEGPDEVLLDESTAERAGYAVGDSVPLLTPRGAERLQPTLVGIAGFPSGGSLNGATLAAFDTATAQALFLDGEDAYTDLWVTAEDGVSQEELAESVSAALPDGMEAVTGDEAADESASDLLEAISFITTFLLIFAGISLVVGAFLIVNTFSILVAQRSRELALLRALGASQRQVTRSVLVEAFVLGRAGLDDRPGTRRAAGDAAAAAVRTVRARPVGPAADLRHRAPCWRRTSSASSSPWRRRSCRPGAPRGSRPCRRCATTSPSPRPRCTAGCSSGSR